MERKIERTFVRQEAYLKLRGWILDGTFIPGMKLRDKQLAEQLGVSRTPIREALLRLEDEGLVQTKPNSCTLVSSIDFHNAFHLYSIVWTLETLALSQAFGSITQDSIQAMEEANERFLQKMKDQDRFSALEADYDFHSVFVKLSQNSELEKIISEIKNKLKRLDLYYFDKIKDAALSYGEHKKIIEALKQKDLSLAVCAVEHNWKNSFSRFNI
jgi:DNA-binding GntR family transcriptional regulator